MYVSKCVKENGQEPSCFETFVLFTINWLKVKVSSNLTNNINKVNKTNKIKLTNLF